MDFDPVATSYDLVTIGRQFVFADVFGGYEFGARLLIEQVAALNLFARCKRTSESPGTLLAFAASDRQARMGGTRADVTYRVLTSVAEIAADRCGLMAQPLPVTQRLYSVHAIGACVCPGSNPMV